MQIFLPVNPIVNGVTLSAALDSGRNCYPYIGRCVHVRQAVMKLYTLYAKIPLVVIDFNKPEDCCVDGCIINLEERRKAELLALLRIGIGVPEDKVLRLSSIRCRYYGDGGDSNSRAVYTPTVDGAVNLWTLHGRLYYQSMRQHVSDIKRSLSTGGD